MMQQQQDRTETAVAETVPAPFQRFEVHPPLLESGKTSTRLVRSDLMSAAVQVVANGGETNLHKHPADEAVWYVLAGKARFYTVGDEVVATLAANEGLLVPRDTPYWFESVSDPGENLVILRIGASMPNMPRQRVDVGQRTFAVRGEEGGIQRDVRVREGVFFGR
jgi:mannose-6-phosphate isomerase-like protein (cupin superfamily)